MNAIIAVCHWLHVDNAVQGNVRANICATLYPSHCAPMLLKYKCGLMSTAIAKYLTSIKKKYPDS